MNISIIGSGTWGVALAIHLARLGNTIKMWAFLPEEAESINKDRKYKNLPEAIIDDKIVAYTNIEEAIQGTDIILHVTPSKFVRSTIKKYEKYVENQPIIMCAKGIEKDSLATLSQVIEEELPDKKYGILSGPSHAEEVAMQIPTAVVFASKDEKLQNLVQDVFMNENMRVYSSSDVIGVEVGGALKNIIAFCAGIATELNLGDNSFAALITRGLVEIRKLGIAMGGNQETFYGLSGLGDLIVTCMSEHSRNRRAGRLIGKGYTVEQAQKEIGMAIESIDNIEAAYQLSKKYNIEMPIVEAVYDVLYNGLEPREAVNMLMTRKRKSE
ncbi:MAG: NAD(P)H-dependent glycerol-3-phosphate dehydrogenase [Clostridia bacterium]